MVPAFASAWSSGDVDGVESLFVDDLTYAVDISGFNEYPIASASDLRTFVAYHSLGEPGEFDVTGCTPGQGDSLRCTLIYRDACLEAIHGAPLHLEVTFRIADGKIREATGGPMVKEATALATDVNAVLHWGQRNSPQDWSTYYSRWHTSEAAAIEAGQVFLRMCEGYAASSNTKGGTATP